MPLGNAAATARNMILDRRQHSTSSREQQQTPRSPPQNFLSSAFTTPRSTEALDPDWRDNVLSAPSTLAPSAPVPMLDNDRKSGGGDTSLVGVHGSARALARMIHFSNSNHAAPSSADTLGHQGGGSATTGVFTSSLSASTSTYNNATVEEDRGGVDSSTGSPTNVGGGNGGLAPTNAIGSWMISEVHDPDIPGTAGGTPAGGGHINEDGTEHVPSSHIPGVDDTALSGNFDNTEAVGGWASESGATVSGVVSSAQDEEEFFVIKPSEGHRGGALAPLLGVWRVYQSQGYPYYLHEASGHSQWEDPRGRESVRLRELSMKATTDVTADVGDSLGRRSQANECAVDDREKEREKEQEEEEEEESMENATIAAETKSTEGGWHRPSPASPIRPTGVPVAVKVAQFGDAAARSAEVSKDSFGAAASEYGEGGERESNRGVNIHVIEDSACRSGLGRASNRTNDGYGSTDGHPFDSIDTAGSRKSNSRRSDSGSSLPDTADEVTVKSEEKNNSRNSGDGYRHDVKDDVAGVISHSVAGITTSSNARSNRVRKGIENRAEEKPWQDVDEGHGCSLLADGMEPTASDGVYHIDVCSLGVSVENGDGVIDGHKRREETSKCQEEDEHDEEWWQELDDETAEDHKERSPSCRRGKEYGTKHVCDASYDRRRAHLKTLHKEPSFDPTAPYSDPGSHETAAAPLPDAGSHPFIRFGLVFLTSNDFG